MQSDPFAETTVENSFTAAELLALLEQSPDEMLNRLCRFVIGDVNPNRGKHVHQMLSAHFNSDEESIRFMRRFQGNILVMPDAETIEELAINVAAVEEP